MKKLKLGEKCKSCGFSPIERNMSTPESRAFWESVEKSAAPARNRPAWENAFYVNDEVCKECGTGRIKYEFDGS